MISKLIQEHYQEIAVGSTIFLIVLSILQLWKKKKNKPKGPFAWPLIGALPAALPYLSKFQSHKFFSEMAKKYGRVCSINLAGKELILVSDPAEATRILNSEDFHHGDALERALEGIVENALFALDGATWKRHRKLLQPGKPFILIEAFGPLQLKYSCDVSSAKVGALVSHWKTLEGVDIDVVPFLKGLTIDVIGMVAFRHDFGCVESLSAPAGTGAPVEAAKNFDYLAQVVMDRLLSPAFTWSWMGRGLRDKKIVEMTSVVTQIVQNLVDERRKEADTRVGVDTFDKDIMERLLFSKTADGDQFSENEIIGEMKAFFFAGHLNLLNLGTKQHQTVWDG